jgi:hypothetical protein
MGTHAYATISVPPAPVISELVIRLALKADRPGLQLMARVVLPRSVDVRSGTPFTVWVPGSTYTTPGAWERLVIGGLPERLDGQVRVLRAQSGARVDAREAYVDMLAVNVYGGAGATRVWLGDPELDGAVQLETLPGLPHAHPAGGRTPESSSPHAPAVSMPVCIAFDGGILTLDGRPFFPQVVSGNGEPWTFLKELGFNTIRLQRAATAADVAQAEGLGLWLICPPPALDEWEDLSTHFGRVLAWDLGDRLESDDLPRVIAIAERVRRADAAWHRPLLCGPHATFKEYCRHVEMIIHRRAPLGTSLEIEQYRAWLAERQRQAPPGVAHWAAVQTEPLDAIVNQVQALRPAPAPMTVEAAQVQLLVATALLTGVKGLVFDSQSRLDGTDDASRHRAASLKLANLQLRLAEPWIVAGKGVAEATSRDPDYRTAVMRTERALLVLAAHCPVGSQFCAAPPPAGPLDLIIPAVPLSSDLYEVTPSGLNPLKSERVAGGTKVSLNSPRTLSMIVVTREPLVINHLARTIASQSSEMTRAAAVVARLLLADTGPHAASFLSGTAAHDVGQHLIRAGDALRRSDAAIAARKGPEASQWIDLALREATAARRRLWLDVTRSLAMPVSSPLAAQAGTLAEQADFDAALPRATMAVNLLETGSCDGMQTMIRAGWETWEHAHPEIQTQVALSSQQRHGGASSLTLRAVARNTAPARSSDDTPIVWAITPSLRLAPGQVVRIEGWVSIPKRLNGPDGLLVFDSCGTPALGHRFHATQGWQSFSLYRVVRENEPLTVTFALTTLGEVFIDDVSITPIQVGLSRKENSGQQVDLPPAGRTGIPLINADTS